MGEEKPLDLFPLPSHGRLQAAEEPWEEKWEENWEERSDEPPRAAHSSSEMQERNKGCFPLYLGLTGWVGGHLSTPPTPPQRQDAACSPPGGWCASVWVRATRRGGLESWRGWQLYLTVHPLPHSGKVGTAAPSACFPGTEIVWEGGCRGWGCHVLLFHGILGKNNNEAINNCLPPYKS